MQVAAATVDLVEIAADLEAIGRAHDGLREPGTEGFGFGRVIRIGRLRVAARAPEHDGLAVELAHHVVAEQPAGEAIEAVRQVTGDALAVPLEPIRVLPADLREAGMLAQQHARCLAGPSGQQVRLLGIEVGEPQCPGARSAALGRVEIPAGAAVRRIDHAGVRETRPRRRRAADAPRAPPASPRRSPAPTSPGVRGRSRSRRRSRRRRHRAWPCRRRRDGARRRAGGRFDEAPAQRRARPPDAPDRRAGPATTTSSPSSSTGSPAPSRWSASGGPSARASSSCWSSIARRCQCAASAHTSPGPTCANGSPSDSPSSTSAVMVAAGWCLASASCSTRTQANLRRGATTPTRRGVKPSSAGSWCEAEVIVRRTRPS